MREHLKRIWYHKIDTETAASRIQATTVELYIPPSKVRWLVLNIPINPKSDSFITLGKWKKLGNGKPTRILYERGFSRHSLPFLISECLRLQIDIFLSFIINCRFWTIQCLLKRSIWRLYFSDQKIIYEIARMSSLSGIRINNLRGWIIIIINPKDIPSEMFLLVVILFPLSSMVS